MNTNPEYLDLTILATTALLLVVIYIWTAVLKPEAVTDATRSITQWWRAWNYKCVDCGIQLPYDNVISQCTVCSIQYVGDTVESLSVPFDLDTPVYHDPIPGSEFVQLRDIPTGGIPLRAVVVPKWDGIERRRNRRVPFRGSIDILRLNDGKK